MAASAPFPGLVAGRKTVAVVGTPERLAPPGLTGWVVITALPANTLAVAIGGEPHVSLPQWQDETNGPQAASGSEEGYPLNPGERFPFQVSIEDVYIDAAFAGEGVCYLYVGAQQLVPIR